MQAVWKHRVRVLLPNGEWFILANIPLKDSGNIKRMRATFSRNDEQEVRVEVEATGADAQTLLIECMERAIRETAEHPPE